MAERRPAGYPKLKNYKPSRFMLPTSLHMHQKLSPRTTFCPKVVSGDNDSIDRQDL